jgi:biopolymer transport protein ExbB
MSLWALIKSGGWIMVPLFGCSVAVCVVFIERILAYRGWIVKNEQFLLAFSNHWLKGDKEGARNLTEKSTTELSEIARIVTSPRGDAARVPAQVERKRQELAVEMRRFLWVLGTIGSSAPFIGLFGTVVGIIESFQNMAQTGSGGFSVVAAGISQALVATAGGIVVAVVSVFFYNYFQVKVARLQFQLKLYTEELLDLYGR